MRLLAPISEIFQSIQGEGESMGKPALFIRLSGCNLSCAFCDTDHTSMLGRRTIEEVLEELPVPAGALVVITGGEPLLHREWVENAVRRLLPTNPVEIETNGTLSPFPIVPINPHALKWNISPKPGWWRSSREWSFGPGGEVRVGSVKVLFPYLPGCSAELVETALPLADWYGIQPIAEKSGQVRREVLLMAISEVMRLGPPWRLSIQSHKLLEMQ